MSCTSIDLRMLPVFALFCRNCCLPIDANASMVIIINFCHNFSGRDAVLFCKTSQLLHEVNKMIVVISYITCLEHQPSTVKVSLCIHV